MTKEEIYEKYWKKLVKIRKIYAGFRADGDTMYILYKKQAESERNTLLKKYGFEPSQDEKG